MIITYEPEDPEEPVWMVAEEIDGKRLEWWNVRLWTGEIVAYQTRQEASDAFWR
jgi:hypothetical protein